MFTINHFLHTHKGTVETDIHFEGGKIPKRIRNCSVKNWRIKDGFSISCDITERIPRPLTVANLCGTCVNKDIFVSIDGAEKKHIYSMHPVKDSKLIRRWWVDADQVLHIQTWPWRAE